MFLNYLLNSLFIKYFQSNRQEILHIYIERERIGSSSFYTQILTQDLAG